jgi:hypothetical protein
VEICGKVETVPSKQSRVWAPRDFIGESSVELSSTAGIFYEFDKFKAEVH